ncbi:uncharacterized protein LOC118749699 [Rhagoletis pomonella]|uniref:uncharacterized protein LOC118749699 n=1 Tax=Rhagoletis pomonella TaxID=28610 RepID=UPI00177EA601|nr:uncharacterized protein LOC118749699 [Rhagoletis pomonella]
MAVLKKQNCCIFKPKNDMCDTCTSYESKNLTQDQYDIHRKDIQDMRNEKLYDIENAKSGLHLLLCIDMQAVKLIPQTNANATYYKMKLQVHNFTIYNVISHESDNFVWDETDGTLVASTFATCIIKYIKNAIKKSPNIHHIIIYSDGCFYQNRNIILSNAILSLCVQENITVAHKYLIVGHTQMECDSTHSLIQRKINKRQINLPSELSGLIRESRKNPFPLKVHHVDYKYFLDYESIPKRYVSIRPGKKSGEPTVNMIRALAYDPSGIIYYKTNINDDYNVLPQRTQQKFRDIEPSQLHTERIPISKKKWEHLQELKFLLPADCHSFYDNIPFTS